MRITKNKADAKCHVCGELMKKGEDGTNYAPVPGYLFRAHVYCVQRKIDEKRNKANT